MTEPIAVAILETGTPPAALAARHETYGAMMRRMLGEAYAYHVYDVRAGELPARPEDHAAYVITGSSAGVYDPLPWIAPLEDFIRAAHGRAALVGICFGHQVMARALGGRVEKSAKGWGLGLHRYDVVTPAPWMGEATARIAVAASHQDQVTAPPPGATVLAASNFTPYAVLAYAGGASMSMQFHPEFTREFAADLVRLRQPSFADPTEADRALASLEAPSDSARVGGWIRGFVDGA